MAEFGIELLNSIHDRKGFDCGRERQNEFLQRRARQHSARNYSKTWVATQSGSKEILGFVTISMGSIQFESIDEQMRSQLPRYPMPVLHVGQLAVALKHQGKSIGSVLLRFAAEKAIEASLSVGCYAIELRADNEKAFTWYQSRGFLVLAESQLSLFQTVKTLIAAQNRTNLNAS